jgi:serine/threonine protein phosphatase PrpC
MSGTPAAVASDEPSALAPSSSDAAEFPAPLTLGPQPRLGGAPGSVRPAWTGSYVPDSVVDGARLPCGVIRAVSTRGAAHRYYGEVRQDSVAVSAIDGHGRGYIVLAVADGLGSAAASHVGSSFVSRRAAGTLAPYLPLPDDADGLQTVAEVVGQQLAGELIEEAGSLGLGDHDVATTLTVAVVPHDMAEGASVAVFAVGDSPVLLLRDREWLEVLATAEDNGEDEPSSTQTTALPIHPSLVSSAHVALAADDVLVLCTDGFALPLHARERAGFYADAWGEGAVPSLPEFLWQVDARVKSYDDDRTVAAFWCGADDQ